MYPVILFLRCFFSKIYANAFKLCVLNDFYKNPKFEKFSLIEQVNAL